MIRLFLALGMIPGLIPGLIPCPPIRQVDLPPVVGDIENHLPAGHPYRDADPITWYTKAHMALTACCGRNTTAPDFTC